MKKVGRDLPTPIRAAVQALLVKEIEEGMSGLESNVQAWREGSERWGDIRMMAMGASNFAGLGTSERAVQKAMELICKVRFTDTVCVETRLMKKNRSRQMPFTDTMST